MAIKKNAFTLTELMIVVALIGAIAVFGIPSYQKMMDKGVERNMVMNLAAIRGGVEIYYARSKLPTVGGWGLAAINTNLDINVQAEAGITYSCNGGVTCSAAHSSGWTVSFTGNPTGTIYCSGGTCPSCVGLPTGCGY